MDSAEHLAGLVGAHALAWFAAALALVLLAILAAWRTLQQLERRAARHMQAPPQRRLGIGLGIRLGTAGVLMAVAVLVFAAMTEALDPRGPMGRFDVALAASLREHVSPAMLGAFALLTVPGNSSTRWALGIAVAAVLLWRGQRPLTLGWVAALAGIGTLNTLLKNLFERARPVNLHGLDVNVHGWSFPSGHSSGTVVAFGMLAYVVLRLVASRWQLPVLLAAAAVAFTTGSSRVLLQVHYASDVVAGFALGLAWLAVCVAGCETLRLRQPGSAPARAGA